MEKLDLAPKKLNTQQICPWLPYGIRNLCPAKKNFEQTLFCQRGGTPEFLVDVKYKQNFFFLSTSLKFLLSLQKLQ